MSIKSKVFAAAATLTLVGGVSTVGMLSAGAATPSCGFSCIDIFSRQFGTQPPPEFRDGCLAPGRACRPADHSCSAPAIPTRPRTSRSRSRAWCPTSTMSAWCPTRSTSTTATAASLPRTSPRSSSNTRLTAVDSGLCVGTATTAIQGEGVTLQPCGVTSKTVWILDTFDQPFTFFFHHEAPAINGSDTNFSHPFVLTYPSNGFPTDIPRPQLQVRNLTGFSNGFGPDHRHRAGHPGVGR